MQGDALYMISRHHGVLARESDALAVTGLAVGDSAPFQFTP